MYIVFTKCKFKPSEDVCSQLPNVSWSGRRAKKAGKGGRSWRASGDHKNSVSVRAERYFKICVTKKAAFSKKITTILYFLFFATKTFLGEKDSFGLQICQCLIPHNFSQFSLGTLPLVWKSGNCSQHYQQGQILGTCCGCRLFVKRRYLETMDTWIILCHFPPNHFISRVKCRTQKNSAWNGTTSRKT